MPRKKPPFIYLRVGKREFSPNLRTCVRVFVALFVFFALGGSLIARSSRVEKESNAISADYCDGELLCKIDDKASSKVKGAFAPLVKEPTLLENAAESPATTAKAAVVYYPKDDAFLFTKNPDLRLPPASTTKIMTALVAIENLPLDRVLTVTQLCFAEEGNRAGFFVGERLNVESLLYGLMVPSGNDAACVLGTSRADFVGLMNKKAKELGLSETSFSNPVGFDGNGSHYSTASDLARLSWSALQSSIFRKIVGAREIVVYSVDGKIKHSLFTTNTLLYSFPGTTGAKTGWTEEAKGCMVLSHVKDGRELVTVVLGSDDRLTEARALTEWVEESFAW